MAPPSHGNKWIFALHRPPSSLFPRCANFSSFCSFPFRHLTKNKRRPPLPSPLHRPPRRVGGATSIFIADVCFLRAGNQIRFHFHLQSTGAMLVWSVKTWGVALTTRSFSYLNLMRAKRPAICILYIATVQPRRLGSWHPFGPQLTQWHFPQEEWRRLSSCQVYTRRHCSKYTKKQSGGERRQFNITFLPLTPLRCYSASYANFFP